MSKNFKDYQPASDWINEQRFYRDHKISQRHEKVTIQMLFDSYLSFARQKNRAQGTVSKAVTYFNLYLKPFFGERDVRAFPIEAHEAFLGTIKGHGRKARTVNLVRALLSVMFNVAMRKRHYDGAIKENPFVFIEKIEEDGEKEPAKYWTAEETQQFLNYTAGSHYYPLWMTLLNTGMRIGEAVALDASQIDTDFHAITIDRTFSKSLKAIQPKSKNGVHYAPVSEALRQVLYPYIAGRHGLVFQSAKGKSVNQEFLVKKIMPRLCKDAGVRYIGLHGMRHTFATQFYLNGGEIEALSRILGHSSVQITKAIYVHFTKLNVHRHSNIISVQSNLVNSQIEKIENPSKIVSVEGNVFHGDFRARVG